MKRLNVFFIMFVAACLIASIGINVLRSRSPAYAQETRKDAEPDRKGPLAKNDRPYPVFLIDDVLVELTKVVEELMKNDDAKNSDTLREDIDRTEFSMKLPPASIEERTSQELYRQVSESVFLVAGLTKPAEEGGDEWQTSFSTAFVVHEDGILSTSAHVFDHDDEDDAVVVMDVKGKVHAVVEILAADRKADTCLFRIATKGLKPLPLGHDVEPGTPIRVMGHPGDSFFFFSEGIIANYERDSDGLIWQNVTADFGQGSSGGPVVDSAGNVVGQVSRTYTLYSGSAAASGQKRRGARREPIPRSRSARSFRIPRTARQAAEEQPDAKMDKEVEPPPRLRRDEDPQMTFKSCTPVSAIRALVK